MSSELEVIQNDSQQLQPADVLEQVSSIQTLMKLATQPKGTVKLLMRLCRMLVRKQREAHSVDQTSS